MKALVNKVRLAKFKARTGSPGSKNPQAPNSEMQDAGEGIEFVGEDQHGEFFRKDDKKYFVFKINEHPSLTGLCSGNNQAYLVIPCR